MIRTGDLAEDPRRVPAPMDDADQFEIERLRPLSAVSIRTSKPTVGRSAWRADGRKTDGEPRIGPESTAGLPSSGRGV